MHFLAVILSLAAVLGLLLMRRASGKDAAGPKAGTGKVSPPFNERHEARRKIVQEAARLREMEDAVMRFGEGSDPAISPEEAERKRTEAARLLRKLEDECILHRFPIALVRRGRASTGIPTALTPGRD